MTLAAELEAARVNLESVLARIADAVRALPDNPRITRHGGKSFTMSAKDLGPNWTPGYHDFKSQYEAVAKELTDGNVMTALDRLKRIISDKRMPDRGRTLHPEVVAHLRSIVEG